MKIWDRKNRKYIEEKECGKRGLEFLYNTVVGRVFLKLIFANKWFSKCQAVYQNSRLSKKKIKSFVEEHDIDMTMYSDISSYRSFSEFFKRKRDIKKYISKSAMDEDKLISIADSKLQVIKLQDNSTFVVKKSVYDLDELIKDNQLSEKYKDGVCLIFRLAVDDYHRYHYLDDGEILSSKYINGKLHTIRPISSKYKAFTRNSRVVSVLKTKNFGEVIQVEVGAMLVGKIFNHKCDSFRKLEEKGYFDFGGSTIIQIFEKDSIIIDDDILKESKDGIETKVQIGMKIGKSNMSII